MTSPPDDLDDCAAARCGCVTMPTVWYSATGPALNVAMTAPDPYDSYRDDHIRRRRTKKLRSARRRRSLRNLG